jgi:hypothetical protein
MAESFTILSQIEGAGQAIEQAAKTGWEAVVVVVILLSFLAAIAFLAKWFVNSFDKQLTAAVTREERLATRITALEDFIHTTLLTLIATTNKALSETTEAIGRLTQTLEDKPCLLSEDRRANLVSTIASAVSCKHE